MGAGAPASQLPPVPFDRTARVPHSPEAEARIRLPLPTLGAVREALEALGIGYGVETSQPGRFYEYPGDPLANGLDTPVNHTQPG
jgi:hypothetical protein